MYTLPRQPFPIFSRPLLAGHMNGIPILISCNDPLNNCRVCLNIATPLSVLFFPAVIGLLFIYAKTVSCRLLRRHYESITPNIHFTTDNKLIAVRRSRQHRRHSCADEKLKRKYAAFVYTNKKQHTDDDGSARKTFNE